MIMFEKFGQHQPLNRQAERYAREGVPVSLSTLADQVGACTAALMPLFERLRAPDEQRSRTRPEGNCTGPQAQLAV
jgi:transposase